MMILYYITESFKMFSRSKFASLVTVFTNSMAVLLTAFSLFVIFLSSNVSDRIKSSLEINVFVKNETFPADINSLKERILSNRFVKSAYVTDKDEALKKFVKETGEDFRSILDVNPLPVSIQVRLKSELVDANNIQSIVAEMKTYPFVDDVIFDYGTVVSILRFMNSVKYIIYALSLLVILMSVYLIFSNNRLQINNNAEKYNTMKFVGATLSAIKIPIILNGVLIGIISSVFCILLINFGFFLLTKVYINFKLSSILILIDILIFALGIFYGAVGSSLAASKISLQVKYK